jgi:hypothetical protein
MRILARVRPAIRRGAETPRRHRHDAEGRDAEHTDLAHRVPAAEINDYELTTLVPPAFAAFAKNDSAIRGTFAMSATMSASATATPPGRRVEPHRQRLRPRRRLSRREGGQRDQEQRDRDRR